MNWKISLYDSLICKRAERNKEKKIEWKKRKDFNILTPQKSRRS